MKHDDWLTFHKNRYRDRDRKRERDYLTPELVNYEFEESNLKDGDGKTTL